MSLHDAPQQPAAAPRTVEPPALEAPPRASTVPLPTLRWSESWIIRAAGLACLILFLGYASSAHFAYQSIRGVAKLAHDEDIEKSLGEHLEAIKRNHALEQELLVTRLEPRVAPLVEAWRAGEGGPSEAELRRWLAAAGIEKDRLDQARYERVEAQPGEQGPLRWLDRDRLRILGFVVTFPKGATYEAFKAAEEMRQRYQLVGVKLEDNIRPTLIRTTLVILVVSFLLLVSLFILYAQRFRAKTFEVIEGFSLWSEKDSSFRFAPVYNGELKLITSQFNSMADEVEANRQRSLYLEKIASWQIIARKLAHEIKNPLTPIQMMVSQLKRRYKGDDPEFQKLLDDAQTIITEEVAGLRRMVDNFSNFARLPQPEPKPTDMVAVCRHAAELEQARFQQHKIGFRSELTEATAFVDEDLIRQVLINLVKNAGEASGEKPATIEVGLAVAGGGADVVVTVKDDGPGIPPELQDRIFEAYFTTKHTGPNPGMGLGLAVCQKIVMDHAGKMAVKSRPGETVFTIRLPRRRKD